MRTRTVCSLPPAPSLTRRSSGARRRGYPQGGIERSPWANPFPIKAAGSRRDAISKFKDYLEANEELKSKYQPAILHRAKKNFEKFYELEPGSATEDWIELHALGVMGWSTAYVADYRFNREGHSLIGG